MPNTTYRIVCTNPFTVDYKQDDKIKRVVYQRYMMEHEVEKEAKNIRFDDDLSVDVRKSDRPMGMQLSKDGKNVVGMLYLYQVLFADGYVAEYMCNDADFVRIIKAYKVLTTSKFSPG